MSPVGCHRRSLLAIASVLSALSAMAPHLLLASTGPFGGGGRGRTAARPSPRHHPDMLGRPVVVQAVGAP
jgi:hypothetical protein